MNSSTCSLAPFTTVESRAARRQAAPFFPLKPISVRTLLWAILLGVGVTCPVVVLLNTFELPQSAQLAGLAQQRWVGYVLHPGALFIKAILIVPLIEEVFYRGIVLQLLRRYCPLWISILVSSAFFGVTHLGNGATNAAFAFVLGGVFAWLVVRTQSLVASIVCHASVNLAWLFLLTPAFGILEKTLALDPAQTPLINPLTDIFPVWWIVVSLVLVTAAVVMLMKSTTANPPRAEFPATR
jgi:membrane protease YdiL (CAAX protease family)